MSIYKYVNSKEPETDGPTTFIQWKGTDVCMDFHCVCGLHMHFDCMFLYFVECYQCHRRFAMGSRVVAVEVPQELSGEVNDDCTWTHDGGDRSNAIRVSEQ